MAITQEKIRDLSESFLGRLDRRNKIFQRRVGDFFKEEWMKCLVLETVDTRVGALRIRKLIRQLAPPLIEKYGEAENQQTFFKWEEFLQATGSSKVIPKFGNLLVLELNDNEPDYNDKGLLHLLMERLNMVPLKKAVLVFSYQYLPDTYVKGISVNAFLKIDEFYNTVTSLEHSDPNELLYESAVSGRSNHVSYLLQNGAKVNESADYRAKTALLGAAEFGCKHLTLMLLQKGALIIANESGNTPLHVAAENGHNDVIITLLEYADDKSDGIRPYTIDIDAQNSKGKTALHLAADLGRCLVVNTLLNYGANVNCKDKNDCTPLHYAAGFKEFGVVKVLVERGAKLDAKNKWQETALDVARHNGYDHIDRLLSLKEIGSRKSVNLGMIC